MILTQNHTLSTSDTTTLAHTPASGKWKQESCSQGTEGSEITIVKATGGRMNGDGVFPSTANCRFQKHVSCSCWVWTELGCQVHSDVSQSETSATYENRNQTYQKQTEQTEHVVRWMLDVWSTGHEFKSLPPTVKCNSWQVVNTRASITKQYNLAPANGWWWLAAGKVGLASHWPRVPDNSGSLRPRRGRWALTYALLVEYGESYLFYHLSSFNGWYSKTYQNLHAKADRKCAVCNIYVDHACL